MKRYLLYFLTAMLLTSCSSVANMTGSKMNELELGMTKEQVISILGKGYTVSEKRIEDGTQIEVLSYRDFYKDDEFYLFQFKNEKLEKWHRELLPKYEVTK